MASSYPQNTNLGINKSNEAWNEAVEIKLMIEV